MYPCPVCDVKLNSVEQRRAHCRGKNHIKREEARKKAEELGTDFDSTPDHCDVCNVPLTSKMTAIDHFKGKMHQKKVKAVEEQRQGFRNYCEICEVRLQSLKVSEAHFTGKQHHKRERKTNSVRGQGKKIPIDKKSSNSRTITPRSDDCLPSQNNFGDVFEETPKNSSSWENLNCDNDSEPKDLLSEFRNLLNSKSLNSPDTTSSSSSPESSTEPVFSFENPVLTISGRQPSIQASLPPPNEIISYFNGEDVPTTLGNLWESQANLQQVDEPRNPNILFSSTESENICAQSKHLMQTQAVVSVLKEADQGISSGDIATKIAELSPSDVNLILSELEKHHLVSKSGYAPILWSLVRHTTTENSSMQSNKTLNGFSYPKKIPEPSPKTALRFQTSKDAYFSQNVGNHISTTEAYPALTAAILASCPTTTTPSEGVRPHAHVIESSYINTTTTSDVVHPYTHVIESNLVNLFQQNGSLTVHDIFTKLNFRDEARLRFILQNLVKRNIVKKDGDRTWRMASPTRVNVGVIGGERKRRSPVQNERSEISRTPTPPKENDHRLKNGFPSTAKENVHRGLNNYNVASPPKENDFRVSNGYKINAAISKENEHCVIVPSGYTASNVLHQKSDKCNGIWQDDYGVNGKPVPNSHQRNTNNNNSRFSPPLHLNTEASEMLEDLIVTIPQPYQKELYEIAMQEDTVCYLPCGTGKELVIAQVIAHMAILNPTKQAVVIVPDIVSALNTAQFLRKELGVKNKQKKLNVALHAGQLKQSNGKVQVAVMTSSTCLGLLNCGALLWKEVCLLIFDHAYMCCNDEASKKILHEYYLKSKMDFHGGHVPKLLSFVDSSAGQENLEGTLRTFSHVLSSMGDIYLSCVTEAVNELNKDKHEAMFVCVQTNLTEEESRMFFLLGTYLNLVFDNLAAQWQPMNSYRELLKISFKECTVISEAFVKLIHLTGQPLEKRLPVSCLKTWRHYLAICEIIFTLVECGEDLAKEMLVNLTHEEFGFTWANDVGLPGYELSRQLMEKEIPNWGSNLLNPRGSGLRDLLDQLMIIQWENARVSSERPLALIIVKLNKTAKLLANYLAQCPQLAKRNVKTTFIDGSRSHHQKTVLSAIKRRQYQVIVSTDNIDQDELPPCELVVLLDQPTVVYALEQLRRRRATNVVAMCRDNDGEEELKELLRREELVEKAVTVIRVGTG
ncbi:uncharacterized protein LOC114537553 [Dendronephthya gigantea]|uniref:uncharacterized protein LOC114537553 n=1 Tax=Dendronephthya gigantea TaxID=151771 RepID=UPI001069B039|nr:uncharacterized protein LOC114537553 [Dendronephthya gigantea]